MRNKTFALKITLYCLKFRKMENKSGSYFIYFVLVVCGFNKSFEIKIVNCFKVFIHYLYN